MDFSAGTMGGHECHGDRWRAGTLTIALAGRSVLTYSYHSHNARILMNKQLRQDLQLGSKLLGLALIAASASFVAWLVLTAL